MLSLFSPDSKFMQFMSRICDLLLLNLVFLLSCIPIVTVGTACTAMYTVCFRFDTEQETGVFKGYFRSFRENFKQATVLWVILLLCGGTACWNALFFYPMPNAMHYGFYLFAGLFVLAVMIAGYVFPLLSQFRNDSLSTFKNALILSIGYLPRSVLITFLNCFPFALLLLNLYLFLQMGFLWIALYFSAAAYLNSLLLKKVFAPYLSHPEGP